MNILGRSFYNAAVPAKIHYVLHGLLINPIDMQEPFVLNSAEGLSICYVGTSFKDHSFLVHVPEIFIYIYVYSQFFQQVKL